MVVTSIWTPSRCPPKALDNGPAILGAVIAERDQLASQLAELTTEHNAFSVQIAELQEQLTATQEQLIVAKEQLTAAQELGAQLPTVTAERDLAIAAREVAVATLNAVQAELDALKNPPVNVRRLPPFSFLNRYTPDEQRQIRAARRTETRLMRS